MIQANYDQSYVPYLFNLNFVPFFNSYNKRLPGDATARQRYIGRAQRALL